MLVLFLTRSLQQDFALAAIAEDVVAEASSALGEPDAFRFELIDLLGIEARITALSEPAVLVVDARFPMVAVPLTEHAFEQRGFDDVIALDEAALVDGSLIQRLRIVAMVSGGITSPFQAPESKEPEDEPFALDSEPPVPGAVTLEPARAPAVPLSFGIPESVDAPRPVPPVRPPASPQPASAQEAVRRVGATWPAAGAVATEPSKRMVSSGFCTVEDPSTPLSAAVPLAVGASYQYWFEIGQLVPGAIDSARVELPPEVEVGHDLTVVLFSQRGGIRVADRSGKTKRESSSEPNDAVGRFRLTGSGSAVLEQPQPAAPLPAGLKTKRLFFRIETPREQGVYWLRCNVFHRGSVLVQSFNVRVPVGSVAANLGRLESTLDYVLNHSLRPSVLNELGEHRLSIMTNETAGTHGFRFFGETEVSGTAEFDGPGVQDLLDRARAAYRRASWGSDAEYTPAVCYRYAEPASFADFEHDLIALAKEGFKLWSAVAGNLAQEPGGQIRRRALQERMRRPGGRIQLALKRSSRLVLPIALFYDHPLDTGSPKPLSLCPTFSKQLRKSPLDTDCFNGGCPQHGKLDVVCPSGFWGFRHIIGLPASLGDSDVAPSREPPLQLSILASAWRGSDFVLSDEHLRGLAGRFGARYEQAENRAQMLERLCRCNAGVIYLYCHGGIDPSGDPYVLVGEDPLSPITVDNLAMLPIDWSESRPLVFVNGCHTTALEPRRALQFVDELVREAHAVGVIGTEITIFEPLAVAFAEKFLGKYEAGSDVGSAIRDARLELLGEQLNPLGLLYIPYVLSTVRWNRPQMPSR